MVIVGDALLLLALFLSANIALAWAELGSFDVHGDKSSLAGLGGAFIFMVLRWLLVAVALAIAAVRGGFAELPGSRATQVGCVLGAHAALGVLSYKALEWFTASIQQGNAAPLRWAWVLAFCVPAPALGAAIWGLNRGWMPRHRFVSVVLVVLALWGHVAAWRAGYRRPVPAQGAD